MQTDQINQDAGVGRLESCLKDRIGRDGPLPVDQFMEMCLFDPEGGYYRTAQPIGAEGDFITAPDISQIFGELIGLWAADVWQKMGQPAQVALVELGPGRGTLAADALRAAKALPQFAEALSLHLVEISQPLREVQARALRDHQRVAWHGRLEGVPEGPAIIIANEFLDALPVRQVVWSEGAWRERCVGLSQDGSLAFVAGGEAELSPADLEDLPAEPLDDTIRELRSGARALIAEIACRAKNAPVASLFIDYGYTRGEAGDTLQAVSRHRYADPLDRLGEQDLTAHVDFAALIRAARTAGLEAWGPMSQGRFLLLLGLEARLQQLMRAAGEEQRQTLMSGARRLIDPLRMGEHFKAVVFTSPGMGAPVPFNDRSRFSHREPES